MTISIASLIYKSSRYADWIHDSIWEFTPHLRRGEAEFYFMANDPTDELLHHLQGKGYKHYVNRNPIRTEEELFKMGYAWPEYMHRVYRGYNKAIESAAGEIVVLLNSDNFVSPDWLENLLKYLSAKTVVSAKTVEPLHPERGGIFPGVYHCEFGVHPDDFARVGFLEFCEHVKVTGLQTGGVYMPCAFYKRLAVQAGLYPEGNIAGKSFNDIAEWGDEAFFGRLRRIGVRHVTAMDSIVYHTQGGETIDPPSIAEGVRSTRVSQTERRQPKLPRPQRALPVTVETDGGTQYLALRPGATTWIPSGKRSTDMIGSFFLGIGAAIIDRLPKRVGKWIRTAWRRSRKRIDE